jgi:hypothetical protein
VIIDTVTPALKIVSAERVGDEVQVSWESQDPQADAASLQLDYRATDQGLGASWQRVQVPALLAGQTRFRPLGAGPITVRLQLNDSSGTPATAVRDLPAAPAAAPPPAPDPAPLPTPPAPVLPPTIQQANSITPPPPAPLGQGPTAPAGPAVPAPAADVPPPVPSAPAPPAPAVVPPAAPNLTDTPNGPAPLPAMRPGAESAPRLPTAAGAMPEYGGPAGPAGRTTLPEVQHVRDRQVAIEFEVERKGPSGVKRVQVFATQDDGRTWVPYWETNQTASPLSLPLPEEEGLYGFRLVLYSGADQSVGPPRIGDLPDVRLQVDRVPPKVSLYPPTIAPGQPNALVLHYSASDPHLDPGSVRLFWSLQPNGGWQPISVSTPRPSSIDPRLKECTWSLPPELPDRVYLRLTACDLAGNEGEFITRDPVTVDLHKPTVRVTGIHPTSQRRP